jgi:hypothetical protein
MLVVTRSQAGCGRAQAVRDSKSAAPAKSLLGYSVGRWDGDTLIVSTTAISWPYISSGGLPRGPASRLEEHFTPAPDGKRLAYTLIITDPDTFTTPRGPEARLGMEKQGASARIRLRRPAESDEIENVFSPERWVRHVLEAKAVLKPHPQDCMVAYQVSTRVNSLQNHDAALIEPVDTKIAEDPR